ncbi:Mu-like prophage major head subunit gpT family protein [Undibacterium sp.]|uniref:Mu-like prophage major head subunit gpT family protein n=1 Tax=Undibacterium sp. TaxID=1914977 RepID=UPI002731756C|nr:Mu-like prophage major head subunit gpT family protein [Undibacterium sp.]MDP1980480.1 Mu-like prophage major head subunit gpT family protein [Undibacterium sp.]
MEINQNSLAALFTGYNMVFQQAFSAIENDYEDIAMTVPSTTAQEVYAWLGQTTRFREWIGDRVVQNLESHDFTIKNKDWENTVKVSRNSIEDDTYGLYKPSMAQLGQDSAKHPGELVWGLIGKGFNAKCYDGQYFFDTDHPVLNEDGSFSSVSNFGGGSGPAWYLVDNTRIIKPIIYQQRKPYTFVALDKDTDANVFNRKEFVYGVDARSNVGFGLWQLAYASKQPLDEDSYAAARQAMMELKGDNGKPLDINPSLLIVPPSMEKQAKKILVAEHGANGATNIFQNTAKLKVSRWLK